MIHRTLSADSILMKTCERSSVGYKVSCLIDFDFAYYLPPSQRHSMIVQQLEIEGYMVAPEILQG